MSDIGPTRSRTDPPAPERTDRPHMTRRLHAASFRSKGQYASNNQPHQNQMHTHRQHAKDTVHSAMELKAPITFDHLLRRDKKPSPESSRRGSNSHQQADGAGGVPAENTRPPVRPEDVAKAKRDNTQREEELRKSLKTVEEAGMSSTRQLDDTYYAILEKASILRSTVASLQHLADESRRMHTSFDEDTSKLERETTQSLNSFGNFDQQEKTINELVNKLQGSRDRTEYFNGRLESARHRVEAFEQRENEKQAQRRFRLHITWTCLLGVVLLIAAIVVARNRRAVGHRLDIVGEQLIKVGEIADDVLAPLSARLRPSPSEDPYLHKLFDEL